MSVVRINALSIPFPLLLILAWLKWSRTHAIDYADKLQLCQWYISTPSLRHIVAALLTLHAARLPAKVPARAVHADLPARRRGPVGGPHGVALPFRSSRCTAPHCRSMSVTRRSLPLAARVISAARAARCRLAADSPTPRSAIAASLSARRVEEASIASRRIPAISGRPSTHVFSMEYPRIFNSSAISDWYCTELCAVSRRSRATPGSEQLLLASQVGTPERKEQAYRVVRERRRDKQDYQF